MGEKKANWNMMQILKCGVVLIRLLICNISQHVVSGLLYPALITWCSSGLQAFCIVYGGDAKTAIPKYF